MAKPFNNFEFATDTNYATGPDVGTPTKVAPSAGEIDSGFVRGTAAVAQHMNYLFGEIQEWLFYLAGLAADSEFLGDLEAWISAHAWTFTATNNIFTHAVGINGTLDVGGKLTTSTQAEFGGLVTCDTQLHVLGNADVDGNLNVDGTTSLVGNVTLGGTLTLPSRTVREVVPLTGFQPILNTGHASIATLPPMPQGWVGAGQGGYGFHFYESSAYGGDRGATAASLNSGNLTAAVLEFTIPRGATLTGMRVGYRQNANGGTVNLYMQLDSYEINSVGNSLTSNIANHLRASDPGVDHEWAATLSVATTNGGIQTGTVFVLRAQASAGSDSFEADLIAKVEISYTTTRVNENG